MVERSPENFAKMFSAWEAFCDAPEIEEFLKKKSNRGLAVAAVLLASAFAQVKPNQEFKYFKAMKLLLEQGTAKNYSVDVERELIAGLLVLATEVAMTKKGERD